MRISLLLAVLPAVLMGQDADPHAEHHTDHRQGPPDPAGFFLMQQSSGTAFQPAAWPMPMLMTRAGSWSLLWMGQGFIVATQQSDPRGAGKIYSANWGMLGASHRLGRGAVMLRTMVSLDPLTITNRQYPLLFQTGESAYGRPIVDGQHPHDLIMELSAQYARPVGENGILNLYYAPAGDAALGPVAYPHRASAMELPQATLSHHWQDSSHIVNNLVTAGFTWRKVRLEASGFRGREPNENRWNVDFGKMDSWSSRLSVFPTKNWIVQVSGARLTRPEASHADDVERVTASVEYVIPRPVGNAWAASVIWGQNYKTVEKRRSNAVLVETVAPFKRSNFITGRFEWSQRDELLESAHSFHVSALTAGYTRDVRLLSNVQTGVGFNLSAYAIDPELRRYYGDHPWGINIFLRLRLKRLE
jgi:hypothetical protein